MGARFRLKLYFIILASALVLVIITGASAWAGIQFSKHDFSLANAGGTPFAAAFQLGPNFGDPIIEEICVFCHTPHGASTDSETSSFLWNRINPQGPNTYNMYSSTTFTAADAKPTGVSMMCMSCHDGVTSIAVNTLLNTPPVPGNSNPVVTIDPSSGLASPGAIGNAYNGVGGWKANIGETDPLVAGPYTINLTNDHPISFTWLAGKAGYYAPGAQDPSLRLFNNRVECATCHKVHDNSIPPFLAMPNTNSDMCRSCHNK